MLGAFVVGGEEQAWLVGQLCHLARISATFPAHLALEAGNPGYNEMAFGENPKYSFILLGYAQTAQRILATGGLQFVVLDERLPKSIRSLLAGNALGCSSAPSFFLGLLILLFGCSLAHGHHLTDMKLDFGLAIEQAPAGANPAGAGGRLCPEGEGGRRALVHSNA
jgi:hypothetical protein